MSKATKAAKLKNRNGTRRAGHARRRRNGRTPNPAFKGMAGDAGLLEAMFDVALLSLMKQAGIRDALKDILMGGGKVTVDIETTGAEDSPPASGARGEV